MPSSKWKTLNHGIRYQNPHRKNYKGLETKLIR